MGTTTKKRGSGQPDPEPVITVMPERQVIITGAAEINLTDHSYLLPVADDGIVIGPNGTITLALENTVHHTPDVLPMVQLTRYAAQYGLVLLHVSGWNSEKPLEVVVTNVTNASVYLSNIVYLLEVRWALAGNPMIIHQK